MPAAVESQAGMAAALWDPGLAAPGAARFAVHRNNVVAGLIAALGAAYPAVRALVGAAFFDAAAQVHVRAHPPRSPVMLGYGAAFPDWIAAFPPAASLPYLADVARLERAWLTAFHAADAAPMTGARLAQVAPERLADLRFRAHPTLGLVMSRHPVVALWAAATGRPGDPVDLARAETAVISRPVDAVQVHVADPGEAALLAALCAGARFGDLVDLVGARGADLGAVLARAFHRGMIADIEGVGDAPI